MIEYKPWLRNPELLVGSDGSITRPDGRSAVIGGKRRYARVSVGGGRTVDAHVVVCEAFHGLRPAGMWALHWNDQPRDNRAENLRWGTKRDNEDDAMRNGGSRARSARVLQAGDIPVIRARRAEGWTLQAIADEFSTTRQNIHLVTSGKLWKHVT